MSLKTAGTPADQDIMTLNDAAEWLDGKLSKATLYRIADDGLKPENDSPFFKVRGKWLTTRADFIAWIRRHPGGKAEPGPMPDTQPPRDSVDGLLNQINKMREAA